MKKCCVQECPKPSACRGMCYMHYSRWQRHGDPGDAEPLRLKGRICTVDGCDKPRRSNGYCWMHYERWKEHGDPNKVAVLRGDPVGRFWQKVNKQGPKPKGKAHGRCWLWTGFIRKNGYGFFWQDGRNQSAHVASYGLLVGPVPEGTQIDHLCRNRACVNPAHLEPVTGKENLLRGYGMAAMNARKTHCKRGHPLSGKNLKIDSSGARQCIICTREKYRRYRERRRHAAHNDQA